MKKLISVILSIIMVVGLLSGCAAKKDSTTTESTATDKPIKIGMGCPLTGSSASYGALMVIGAQIAVDEINNAGGINGRKVEMVNLDDKNDPKEAALVAQRFADDPDILGVVAHGGSSLTLAAAPIYEKAGLTNMAPSSANPQVTEMGYTKVVRHVMRDDRQGPQVIAFLVNNMKMQKIGILYANDDYGRGNLEAARSAAGQLGTKLVDEETYNPGLEKDFTAQLTKLQKAGVDGVALYCGYNEGGLILGQAKQLGMDNIVWCGQSSLTYKKLIELATPEALQKLSMIVTFNPYDSRPAVQKFMKAFNEIKPNEIPSEPCAFTYDIINVFKQAIEQGATKENLAEFIKGQVDGKKFIAKNLIMGDDIEWDKKGDIIPRGVEVLEVSESGEFVKTDMSVDITGLTMPGIVE